MKRSNGLLHISLGLLLNHPGSSSERALLPFSTIHASTPSVLMVELLNEITEPGSSNVAAAIRLRNAGSAASGHGARYRIGVGVARIEAVESAA